MYPRAYLILLVLLARKEYDKILVFLADKHAHTPGKIELRKIGLQGKCKIMRNFLKSRLYIENL